MEELYDIVKGVKNKYGRLAYFFDFGGSNGWPEISINSILFFLNNIPYTHYTFDITDYYHLQLYTEHGIVVRTCLTRREFMRWWENNA